uniref:Uncharacterized protein n=1 Tax=Arundo donax TaxID=35708 RepID=A0A0A9HQF4_ARUDO
MFFSAGSNEVPHDNQYNNFSERLTSFLVSFCFHGLDELVSNHQCKFQSFPVTYSVKLQSPVYIPDSERRVEGMNVSTLLLRNISFEMCY